MNIVTSSLLSLEQQGCRFIYPIRDLPRSPWKLRLLRCAGGTNWTLFTSESCWFPCHLQHVTWFPWIDVLIRYSWGFFGCCWNVIVCDISDTAWYMFDVYNHNLVMKSFGNEVMWSGHVFVLAFRLVGKMMPNQSKSLVYFHVLGQVFCDSDIPKVALTLPAILCRVQKDSCLVLRLEHLILRNMAMIFEEIVPWRRWNLEGIWMFHNITITCVDDVSLDAE